jgi:hypothetical protein
MSRVLPAAALLAALSLRPAPARALATHGDPADTTAYGRWYQALRNAAPDASQGAPVTDLTLKRDAATLHFTKGTLNLLPPTEGRVWGAVFIGEGTFSVSAPIAVEQEQLRKTFGAKDVVKPFRTAVLFFTDSTAAELSHALHLGQLAAPSGADREVEEALKYLTDDKGWVSRDLMVPLLDASPGFFYAHVAGDRGDPVMFMVDPYDAEQISVARRAGGKVHGDVREVVSQFRGRKEIAAGSSISQEDLDLIRVDHYDIESTIEDNLDYTGKAVEHVLRVDDAHPWVPFTLYPDLKVDSVRWVGGPTVAFVQPEKSGALWVDLSAAPANASDLAFYYHGDILDRPRGLWVVMKTFTNWYPMHEYGRPATYRLTFHTPRQYQVATVGRLVSEKPGDKTVTRVWETPTVRQISFDMGTFVSRIVRVASPRVTVEYSAEAHKNLGAMAAEAQVILPEQSDMLGAVGADLSQAFSFFSQAFGPTPVNDFTASEIYADEGEAFPGLVLLSWTTFQTTDKKGFDELFRAHEVAHQWWGIGVRPATYHDWWLAEGFSEFAGIWYMARVRGSVDLYEKQLEESEKTILKRRDDAAPVWLGLRAATSRHPEDYQTVVYDKGAWVLNMLRSLLTNYNGGAEDAFDGLMHDFYSSHLGKSVTTADFQQAVAARLGADEADWFFKEWVYGSAIPKYTFSYRVDAQADGKYRVRVRVRQEKVPDDFKMLVPILLDFGAKGTRVERIMVSGPLTETELPPVATKPEHVRFNPFDAVLAETKTEGWKGN